GSPVSPAGFGKWPSLIRGFCRFSTMRTHRIALYPGDGIGPEVTDAAVAVLSAAKDRSRAFDLAFERFDWGMPHYERHGCVAPEDFLSTLRGFDAVFLGAVGWP